MGIADLTPAHPSGEIITTAAVGGFAAHIWGWLPGTVAVIGGLLAIVWYTLMIAESKYVQAWLTRHMENSKKRQITRLNEKLKRYERQFDETSAKLVARRKIIEARLEALGIMKQAEAIATQKVETAKVVAAQKLETAKAATQLANRTPSQSGGEGDART